MRGYWALLWLAAIGLLFLAYTAGLRNNPPGSYLDESAIGYNAYRISQSGVSESGVRWPLFFQFYTDAFTLYGNPTYIYLLAALYSVFPPSIWLARLLSAALGFTAALLLGVLAAGISRRRLIGAIVTLTALATPWLFEISRLVFEVALYPLTLVLFLCMLYRVHEKQRWSLLDTALLAATLALLTYTYTIGRLLGPLLAFGLLFFANSKRHLADVLKTWMAYSLTLVPLFVFNHRHPGALTERFLLLTYVKRQSPWGELVYEFAKHCLENLSLVSLLLDGDTNPRHHVPGSLGSLLVPTFLLAATGIVLVLLHHRENPWWRFTLFGLAASIVPASLTVDQFHTLRLIAYPIFLLILTVPALAWLLDTPESQGQQLQPHGSGRARVARRLLLAVFLAFTVLQATYFQVKFRREGPKRGDVFDTAYQEVFAAATALPARPIYLVDGYWGPAYIHAYWYATLEGRKMSEFVHLPGGVRPPAGSLVIISEENCENCQIILKRGTYILYRAP